LDSCCRGCAARTGSCWCWALPMWTRGCVATSPSTTVHPPTSTPSAASPSVTSSASSRTYRRPCSVVRWVVRWASVGNSTALAKGPEVTTIPLPCRSSQLPPATDGRAGSPKGQPHSTKLQPHTESGRAGGREPGTERVICRRLGEGAMGGEMGFTAVPTVGLRVYQRHGRQQSHPQRHVPCTVGDGEVRVGGGCCDVGSRAARASHTPSCSGVQTDAEG
jgi:hypothetical protein